VVLGEFLGLLVITGCASMVIGSATNLYLIRLLRRSYPHVLLEIDPSGYRAFYFVSQMRFLRYELSGALFSVPDRRVKACSRVLLLCHALVFAMLVTVFFFHDVLAGWLAGA
jgi:hypothetical protein